MVFDKGQYDFVLDDGTSVTQLTSDNDLRSRVQAGTKIVMRAVIDEVVSSFSAKYWGHCGTWNSLKTDTATLSDALAHGCCITCYRCKQQFQVPRTKSINVKKQPKRENTIQRRWADGGSEVPYSQFRGNGIASAL